MDYRESRVLLSKIADIIAIIPFACLTVLSLIILVACIIDGNIWNIIQAFLMLGMNLFYLYLAVLATASDS